MRIAIETSRFGNLEVVDDQVLHLPEGLIGIDCKRWVLITREPESPFLWLQSLEEGDLALPVVQPEVFFPSYSLQLSEQQLESTGLHHGREVEVLCVVKAREELADFTINLRGPLLFDADSRQGAQMVNLVEYPVDANLWQEVGINQIDFSHPDLPILHHQVEAS